MGMFFNEAHGDEMIEGLRGCTPVKRKDRNIIEVWCEEYDLHYGDVPGDYTPQHIHAAMSFYRAGEAAGVRDGELRKQQEIRKVLGLDPSAT